MPQLSIETFVSQYFWLVVLFFYFYLQMVNRVIPKIAQILKIRKEVSNVDSGDAESTASVAAYSGPIDILTSVEKTSNVSTDLNKTVITWCDKNLK